MKVRDLPIGSRQRIGFSLIFLFLTAVAGYSIARMASLRNELDTVNDIWIQRMRVLSQFNGNAASLHNVLLQYAISGDDEGRERQRTRALGFVDGILLVDSTYQVLKGESIQKGLYTAQEGLLYDDFESGWERYQDVVIEMLTLSNRRLETEGVTLLQSDAQRYYDDFERSLQELIELNEAQVSSAARRARQTFTATRNQIMVLLIGAFLVSFAIATWQIRSITRPVGKLVLASRELAVGNLDTRVPVDRNDELGRLSRSFNWMAKSLRDSRDKTAAQANELRSKNEELEGTLDQLKSAQAQLITSEKMASLGHLTAGIAHEIKNPLNFVNNFAELSTGLTDEIVEDLSGMGDLPVREALPEIREALADLKLNAEKIAEHGKRADGIVQSMLAHSRGQSGERRPTDINVLVGEYLNLAFHGARANDPDFSVDLEKELDPAVGDVVVVPQDIGRVLLNLINNAFFAVDERSRTAEERDEYRPIVRVVTRRLSDEIEIRIVDNGLGIPDDVRPRIFEPFFTTKPTGSGTGLGLSLSYELVTQGHGGRMSFEDTQGGGTTFLVTLPA